MLPYHNEDISPKNVLNDFVVDVINITPKNIQSRDNYETQNSIGKTMLDYYHQKFGY